MIRLIPLVEQSEPPLESTSEMNLVAFYAFKQYSLGAGIREPVSFATNAARSGWPSG